MNVQPDKEAAREAAEEGGGSHLGRSPTPDELPSESPPSLPHRTINLQVGSTAQYYFQSTLFYSSEIWLDLLRSDVRDLLDAFVRRWETGLETATTEGDGKSGFEVFVEVWKELGWEWIVLLGAVEGEVRQAWGRSIVSVVVASIDPSSPPLHQLCALFTLYTLTTTQPPTLIPLLIPLPPSSLSTLLSLPSTLHSIPPPLLQDLNYTLLTLLSSESIVLVPSSLPVPLNRIEDKRRADKEKEAIKVSAVKLEVDHMRLGEVRGGEGLGDKRRRTKREKEQLRLLEREKEEVEGSGSWEEERRRLRDLGGTYVEGKFGGVFENAKILVADGEEGGSGAKKRKKKVNKTGTEKAFQSLQRQLLETATGLTLDALQKASASASSAATATTGAGIVPSLSSLSSNSLFPLPRPLASIQPIDLFNLVGGSGGGGGIGAYEVAMGELGKLEMVVAEEGEEEGDEEEEREPVDKGKVKGKRQKKYRRR